MSGKIRPDATPVRSDGTVMRNLKETRAHVGAEGRYYGIPARSPGTFKQVGTQKQALVSGFHPQG
jgi:hypothetical protein